MALAMAQFKEKTSGVNSLLASRANGPPESSGLLRSETMEKLHLPRLYFTREEARAILASAPQAQELVAVDFAANRAQAISGDLAHYRIVHFAPHTLLDTLTRSCPEWSCRWLMRKECRLTDSWDWKTSTICSCLPTLSFSGLAKQPWEGRLRERVLWSCGPYSGFYARGGVTRYRQSLAGGRCRNVATDGMAL